MKKFLAIALSALLVIAMAVPASAAISSVEQQVDPHAKQVDVDGQKVDVVIKDKDGNKVDAEYSDNGTKVTITDTNSGNKKTYQLVLFSYNKRESAPTEIREALEAAAAKSNTYSNKDLSSIVCAVLQDEEGNYVTISEVSNDGSVAISLDKDYALIVDENGNVVSLDNVSGDGILLLYDEIKTANDTTGKSPQTGYESQSGIVVAVSLVAALVAVVGICYVADKKRA